MTADLALAFRPKNGSEASDGIGGVTAADRPNAADQAAVFAFGLSLQFNVITSTFGLPFMRLSDLVPFLLIPYLCLRTDFIARSLDNAPRISLVLVLLIPSLFLKADKGPGDLYYTLILALYVVQALQILTVLGGRLLPALCAGILAGYFGSLAVLLAAGAGFDLEAYGLAVPIATDPLEISFRQDKLGGLWSSGNQTGHIFAAAGAPALYLSGRFRSKAIYFCYIAGLIISFPLTNNRAGLLAPALGLLFVMRRDFRAWHLVAFGSAVGAVALYAGAIGSYPLPDPLANALKNRLYADEYLDTNLSERLNSGLQAIGLMGHNPFGIGITAMENALLTLTGVDTPHNGILSLALLGGIPVALLYLLSLFQIVIDRPHADDRFVYFTILFSTPSMFFEQLTETQYFLFIIAVALAAWASRGTVQRAGSCASGQHV